MLIGLGERMSALKSSGNLEQAAQCTLLTKKRRYRNGGWPRTDERVAREAVLFEGHHRRASWRRASRLNHRGVAWEEGGHPGYLTTVGGLLTSGVYAGTVMTPDSWDVSAEGGSSWRTR